MKRLALLLLCASLFLCACARTQPEETTAQTPLTETTTAQTTTQATTAETTTTEETTTVATETTYVEALGETKIKLSTMSEEDCRKFLAESGVTIRKGWELLKVSAIFAALENDPNMLPIHYYVPISTFDSKFRSAIWDYLSLSEQDPLQYPKFSEMTNKQCMEILKEYGIEIPVQLYNFDIKKELSAYELDENHSTFGGLIPYNPYFEDIRYVFNAYYGIPDNSRSSTLMGKPRLSLMSEEECKEFILEAGIDIPPAVIRYYDLKYVIWQHEQDPYYTESINNPSIYLFFKQVRVVISEYYGFDQELSP